MPGNVKMRAADAELSGRLVAVAEGVTKAFGDRVVVRDFSTADFAGRPRRHRRTEWGRKNNAAQSVDRCADARCRVGDKSAPISLR